MPGGSASDLPNGATTEAVLPGRLFGERALLEERDFAFVEAPEPFRIDRSQFLGSVDPAQGPVHEET